MPKTPRAIDSKLRSKRNSYQNQSNVSISSLTSSSDASSTRSSARSRSSCLLVGEPLIRTALQIAVNGTREQVEILVYCYKSFLNDKSRWGRQKRHDYETELQEMITNHWRKNGYDCEGKPRDRDTGSLGSGLSGSSS